MNYRFWGLTIALVFGLTFWGIVGYEAFQFSKGMAQMLRNHRQQTPIVVHSDEIQSR